MKSIPDKNILLFRSCLVSVEYPGVEASTKFVFDKLGVDYAISEKPYTRVRFGIGTINAGLESFSVEVYDSIIFDDESGYKARLDLWSDANNKPHLKISGPNGANPVDLA